MPAVPAQFRALFWDVAPETLDSDYDEVYILGRILEFGQLVHVRWAIATYGLERIHDFFRTVGHPELSARTLSFWRAFFRAEKESWASPPAWRKSNIAPWVS